MSKPRVITSKIDRSVVYTSVTSKVALEFPATELKHKAIPEEIYSQMMGRNSEYK